MPFVVDKMVPCAGTSVLAHAFARTSLLAHARPFLAGTQVVVYPPDTGRQQMLFNMEAMLAVLPKVCGGGSVIGAGALDEEV